MPNPSEQLKLVIDSARIAARVRTLAQEIEAWRQGEPLLTICVLKGAFIFFADLVRQLSHPVSMGFLRASSYGKQDRSSGQVRLQMDLDLDVRDKRVLLVEDIVDTGLSLKVLREALESRNPAALAVCALVDKSERREYAVNVEFPGFHIRKGFLVGYGLDYAECYRELPDICELHFS